MTTSARADGGKGEGGSGKEEAGRGTWHEGAKETPASRVPLPASRTAPPKDFSEQRRDLRLFEQKTIVPLWRFDLSILRTRDLRPAPHVEYRIVEKITRN